MLSYDPMKIANAYLELWNNRNPNPFKALLAPTATIRYVFEKEDRPALKSLEEYDLLWHNAFPDAKWTTTDIIPTTGTLTLEWICTGTHMGAFRDIPATGRTGEVHGAAVFKLNEDGKIVKETVHMDMTSILSQIGRLVPPLEDTKLRGLALAFVDTFNRHDVAGLASLCAPNPVILRDDGLRMTDKEHTEWLSRYLLGVPDSKMQATNVAVRGNEVVVEGVLTGTHQGPLFGIPATNRPVKFDTCSILTFEGDKIQKHRYYNDLFTLRTQIAEVPETVKP